MRKHCWLLVALVLASACSEVDTKSCKISCSADADCPAGLACGDLGLCAASGDTCSCEPGEFIACDKDSALYCNSGATGVTNEGCGAAGCNADAERCNACVANATACSADLATLDQCDSEGVVAESTTCAAGCIPGSVALDDDRCGYIKPVWLNNVCDAAASTPEAMLTGTLDVQQDAACSGGVLDLNGTTFCVVRAAKIDVGDLKVTGTRAIAFVADDEVKVTGTLDVSADSFTPGPGAARIGAGTATTGSSYKGGGGAGFGQSGGFGGGNDTGSEAGMPGGPVTERLTTDRFVGGATTTNALCGTSMIQCFDGVDFAGGGGGGGALLIACRGTVNVTGTIDAGGGGGTGGGDHYPNGAAVAQGGAPGGGSGGFVVLQGAGVQVSGNLYANGGGGGAGCAGDNCRGLPGSDGLRSTSGAPGGDPAGNSCGGGIGGSVSSTPGAGEQTFSNAAAGSGGGGGSMGRFEVFTPSGRPPVLAPAQASPNPVASTTSLVIE